MFIFETLQIKCVKIEHFAMSAGFKWDNLRVFMY